jgi:uncharacterized membrane protein YdbT with pleckstrin-like domain
MSYVESNLMPEEHVVHTAKVHWCVFMPGIPFLAICLLHAAALGGVRDNPGFFIFMWVAIVFFVRAFLLRATTEFAVTSRRVVVKFGAFRHHSIELNLSKVESFEVVQGILGRMFGYGTINVNGTGGVRTSIRNIDKAVEFRRNAVAVVHAAQSVGEMRSRVA